jgi:hypothetical protein
MAVEMYLQPELDATSRAEGGFQRSLGSNVHLLEQDIPERLDKRLSIYDDRRPVMYLASEFLVLFATSSPVFSETLCMARIENR